VNTKIGRPYLTWRDFEQYSIWRFNDRDDLSYPVLGPEDFPKDSRDLRIRAEFIATNGIKLKGAIIGLKNIFCISIYIENNIFIFNKNLLNDCIEELKKLNKILEEELVLANFSPIKYTTNIDLKNFRNISGEFDLLKKRTDAERLEGF